MTINRRRLFAALALSASAATPALASETGETAPHAEIDATSLGILPNSETDQSAALQRAIARAAAAGAVLRLAPGIYRAGGLQLPSYAAIAGVAGTTQLVLTGALSLLSSAGSDHISLSGLLFDGGNISLPEGHGLLHLMQGRGIRIANCEIVNAGGNGIALEAIAGEVSDNTVTGTADYGVFSNDAAGLKISGNTVSGAGDGGILVWRGNPGDDGTIVADNRVEDIKNKSGGSGQYGNAINIFRADNVIVRGNRIRNAAYTAVRGNSAANLQIVGNTCTGLGEVALYAEFGSQGAVIANNVVDGAAAGVSVTNFDKDGRLAVVQGNMIRNLRRGRPAGDGPSDTAALGIGVEADTVVNGNVMENVDGTGIQAGWGPYLRDVTISANVVRNADYGIAVSVAFGAGAAVIANNLLSGTRLGAIVGMEWTKVVADDLSQDHGERYAQLSIDGNRVR
jgi:uncharacterized secreted repeat protein (TIGR03808 family)